MSPTARALLDLRKEGWLPWVVERRIGPFTRDLFNCLDIVAINGKATMGIQVTSGNNHAGRVAKVYAAPHLGLILASGWHVEVWSYRKLARTGKWALRREPIFAMLDEPRRAGDK